MPRSLGTLVTERKLKQALHHVLSPEMATLEGILFHQLNHIFLFYSVFAFKHEATSAAH